MVNRLIEPFFSFVDSTGAPREDYRLFFYAHGTSTKLDVYTDATGTLSANPLTLNSLGQCPNDVFGQDLAYKIVLASPGSNDPPTGSEVETYTNVSTSDFTARAKFTSYNGNPNTHVAGTAGTGSTPADAVWDYTNSVLYFCTTTGVAAAAVWTAYNPNTSTAIVPPPQGRLTLTSGTPVLSADVAAATSVYYTPYAGNLVPIYSGTAFVATTFTERTLSLVSSHSANAIFDVFAFSDSGVFTVGTGPAWTTATAGSGARGTSAGTTELTRLNGLWVNAVQITARNGSSTYTVAANKATYIGSIATDGSNGQISCSYLTFGGNRICGVWNAYNRVMMAMVVGDATSSWNYNTNTIRQSLNSTANKGTILLGLPEEMVDVEFSQFVVLTGGDGTSTSQTENGIGINSTSSYSGKNGSAYYNGASGKESMLALYEGVLAIGIHNINCLERTAASSGTTPNAAYQGTSALMRMVIRYRA